MPPEEKPEGLESLMKKDLQEQDRESQKPESPPKSTAVRDYLKENLGYNFEDDVDDTKLAPQLGRIVAEYKAMEARLKETEDSQQQHEAVLQDYLQNSRSYHEWLQSQKAKEKEPEVEKKAPKQNIGPGRKWERHEYNQEWEGRVRWDEDAQRFVPATKWDSPSVAEEANRWYAHQKEVQRRMASDPWGLALEAGGEEYLSKLRSEIKQEIEEAQKKLLSEWQNRSYQAHSENQLQTYFSQHAADYFELDERGQPKVDSLTGDFALTPKGRAYFEAEHEAREYGIMDPLRVHNYALTQSERIVKPAPPKKEEPEEEDPRAEQEKASARNREQKRRFLERKSDQPEVPQNAIMAAAGGEPSKERMSFLELALRDPDNAEILGADFKG